MKKYSKRVIPLSVFLLIMVTVLSLLSFITGCNQTGDPGSPTSSVSNAKPLVYGEYEVRVMGDNNFMAGSQGSIRVVTYDPATQQVVAGVPVRIFLASSKQEAGDKKDQKDKKDYGEKVFEGITDATGSLSAIFPISQDKEGNQKLTILTGQDKKSQEVGVDINIQKKFKIYLTTDKPLYQPGQLINIRALALNVPSLTPVEGKDVLIEVEDAKGNKVFKKTGKTSKFGIGSAKFQLADEVNMGEYHVRAFVDKESSDKSVTVKKYVLPKFKIGFKKDKTYYSPGDTLQGDLQVDYFFGKPVAGGNVEVKLYTFDVEFREAVQVKGKTDDKGHYKFEVKLPDYLVGQPLEKGNAITKMDIVVEDTAEHKETSIQMIPVSKESLRVELLPESGSLKKGMENRVFLLTSYPDGSPAKSDNKIAFDKETRDITTDSSGITTFTVTPENNNPVRVKITAKTKEGNEVSKDFSLPIEGGEENIILRTDKATYKVGETINMELLSTKKNGSLYLDFVKNNQTVLTKAFDLKSNRDKYSMDVSPELMGMVQIHAYMFTKGNQIIRDTRNVYIRSADDLKITVKPNKDTLLPGEDATINLNVSDKNGKPVVSAMGVDIVDEALLAMGEMMPGLERVYFLLEKELMEPKYEIHGMTLTGFLDPDDYMEEDKDMTRTPTGQETIKTALFTKLPGKDRQFVVNIDTYKEKMRKCYENMAVIYNNFYQFYQKEKRYPHSDEDLETMISYKLITRENLTDPWGNKFHVVPAKDKNLYPDIKSYGPDGKADTDDDLTFTALQQRYYEFMNVNQQEIMFGGPGGRFRGGVMEEGMVAGGAPPRPSMADGMVMSKSAVAEAPTTASAGDGGATKKTTRVREYFPETLYTNPEVITDEKGNATISLKMADSITTWRLTAFANSLIGQMGNVNAPIRVFQDFFIDIDFPVSLTQGDEVSVPVAVYNYLKENQTVKIKVDTKEDWFTLTGDAEKSLSLKPNEVTVVYFRIKVLKLGDHRFTVHGEGSKMSDAIRREIEVVPNGKEYWLTDSNRLEQDTVRTVEIPQASIPDASKILVRLYPGVLSQVVEGLDNVFRMPGGCFEQTSASTFPNALVLDYLKRQKKITPELQMKAEGYINTGVQRLLSFEVQGGGFSWFGDAPANKCLTAFGIMEFRSIQKVHDMDENVINRTMQWLASQQKPDGSWEPDKNYLHAESWSRMQNSNVPVTAYVVWSLAESGYKGHELTKGLEFLKKNVGQLEDPYFLALVCNALAIVEPESPATKDAIQRLVKMATVDQDSAHWQSKAQTATFTSGDAASLETTAIACMALLRINGQETLAGKVINYIIKSKDPNGTWSSTQGTILCMKALLLSADKSTQKVNAKITITVNGKESQDFTLTSENYDVYQQADFGKVTQNGTNQVSIKVKGEGSCYYQIATKYYIPWTQEKEASHPLSIALSYDRNQLRQDDTITCDVKVKNNTGAVMNMVMVDLGVPPGFEPQLADLTEIVGKKIKKFTPTSRQIIIYLEKLEPYETLQFKYRLKAKYPMKAQTPRSRAYQYYNPEIQDFSKPVSLEVQ